MNTSKYRTIRISDKLATEAQLIAKESYRSLAGQVAYWVKLGYEMENSIHNCETSKKVIK